MNWFRELERVEREREPKSEEKLNAEISEAYSLAVLYKMVGLGWQQDSRCGVMITVVVWFYQRVTVGGIAEGPGKWGGRLDTKSERVGQSSASGSDPFAMKIRTNELGRYHHRKGLGRFSTEVWSIC